jgi:5'-nucleotidase
LAAVLSACSSSGSKAGTTSTTAGTTSTTAPATLQVLVTNDDGVTAPGIDAAVQGLRSLPDTKVTVVAPATNESGTGGKTTPGTLTATAAKTASGYTAKAVHGYPADTIRWAIDEHGISFKPDLVVSGINFGQNIGPLVAMSGTVGAARAAAARGIPAIAVSAGLPTGGAKSVDFAAASKQLDTWVTQHRTQILAKQAILQNLNVPTCAPGATQRGVVNVPVATQIPNGAYNAVNCSSTATNPANDVQAFDEGFEPLSNLTVTP